MKSDLEHTDLKDSSGQETEGNQRKEIGKLVKGINNLRIFLKVLEMEGRLILCIMHRVQEDWNWV